MPKLLQITFQKPPSSESDSDDDEGSLLLQRANKISTFPGLIWKIWIANHESNTFGGTYLFQDEASAKHYLASPIPDDIRHLPSFKTEIFDVEEEFSAITHAPLERPSPAATSS
uniref:Uncharacterized protein n=1 Tax=Grammatophora oceanica TaxID=210454 RepID=A0A7S1UZD2_9STRA|mmetsp:Transcript_28473/g.41960  ORF Transcript_28473/g.41960 Transcript_28473/m.41960 type:complete len:114 (+) Transcript_28473:54-395(+)|eukprot:CAMPEP_0194045270 /NCGR_PEP_ID=MMETSP0009_2-20130614/16638_1 /TAXON_ID=210454 /ORGANISM="Grammatophora oceanica, Strain CCMP 410" /LENGTH=113 /DNA_ID=CAMNT_0038690085 /DNA_START=33 /DNA_END=374 /DNA_ORIENTATION=-